MRAEAWYIFGLLAVALIFLRLRSTWRHNEFKDPVSLAFSLGLFLGAFGTLSKQPFLAVWLDTMGTNTAWLVADILFMAGLCAGTYWVDLMSYPDLRNDGWKLLQRWRIAVLIFIAGYMVFAAQFHNFIWVSLERGGIDVGGSTLLLAARLGYFLFVLWALSYLSIAFYQHRKKMTDRFNYIRLSIPFFGITLAIIAPALQLATTLYIYIFPVQINILWPRIWLIITAIQLATGILIVFTFFPPAYKTVVWLDKQLLIRRLMAVIQTRKFTYSSRFGFALQPDVVLTSLVNEMEITKRLLGHHIISNAEEIKVPAGRVMPDAARYALQEEQALILQGGKKRNCKAAAHRVIGDTYAIARWYAAVVNRSFLL